MATDTLPDSDRDNLQELEDLYNAPSYTGPRPSPAGGRSVRNRPSVSERDARAAKNRRTGTAARQAARRDSSTRTATNLADQEANAAKEPEYKNQVLDKLNKGYVPDKNGKKGRKSLTSRLYNSNSNLKKRVAIAGVAAGGSALAGLIIFVALLPLKLEFIVQNIERKYSAAVTSSMDKEIGNMFNNYVARSILPSIFANECKSTVDPHCKVTPHGTGAMGSLYKAWADGNLEYKLATQHGIIIGKEAGTFYMSINGERVGNDKEFQDLRTGKINPKTGKPMTIFDLSGNRSTTRNEIRTTIRTALKDSTRWDKAYTRYKLGKLLERKYGIKRCVIACKTRDKIADAVDTKKVAGKAYLLQRMMPEKYSLMLTCVIAGATGSCDPSKLDKAATGEAERLSPFQKQLQDQMVAFVAKYSDAALADLVKSAQEISEKGLKNYLTEKAIEKLVGSVLGDAAGKTAGELTVKSIPVVGWVVAVAGVVASLGTAGTIIAIAAYQSNVATSVQAFETVRTVAAECKTGHCDIAEEGSFDRILATSISGDPSKAVNFTQSRLWQQSFPGYPTSTVNASVLSGFMPSTAWAAGTEGENTYLCDDNKPIPADKQVCPELNYRQDGNAILSNISDGINAVPGLATIAGWIKTISDIPGDWISKGLEKVPGYDAFAKWTGDLTSGPLAWIQKQLMTTPNIDSGAKLVDVMMAGADAAYNSSCRIQLGCAKVSDQVMADIQNEQLAEDKASFDAMPMFARIFNTSTPYSLVSRMAVAMPSDFTSATATGLATVLVNPFQRLASMFSATLPGRAAFAAPQTALPDAFGITHYAHTSVPDDPDAYWNKNCINGPFGTYDETSDTLDVSGWLNTQTDEPDMETGEPVGLTPNYCQLIHTTRQVAGVTSSAKQIPQSETNPDQ